MKQTGDSTRAAPASAGRAAQVGAGPAVRPGGPSAPTGPRPLFLGKTEFAALGPGPRDALAAAAVRRSFAVNDIIYLQDDDAEHLYFVQDGHVRLSYLMEDGSAVLFGILPPGESFGELGVFEDAPHADMATAATPLVVASVAAPVFRALAGRYPEIGTAIARLVARRYRSYLDLTRMLSLKTLAARLAQALLRLADSLDGSAVVDGRKVHVISSVVTQTDLGLMARGSRGNVNRALKGWERAGWIRIQERRIVVVDRARLEALALQECL